MSHWSSRYTGGLRHPACHETSGIAGTTRHSLRGAAVLSLALLAACATPATRSAHVAEPTPCRDSTYLQLKEQQPDSLSERAWQRLQAFDRDCAAARAQARRESSGMMATDNRGGHWMAIGLGAVMMVAMIVAMW